VVAGYGLMLAAAAGLFFLIRSWGETLPAPTAPAPVPAAGDHGQRGEVFAHVLLTLVAIIITGGLLGRLFARLGQPRVIGEVVAGIVLGPSVLGWLWPGAAAFVLPASVGPFLGVLAQLGVVLYMFLVGLQMSAGQLRAHAHSTVAISHASIVAPFVFGSALALWLYPHLAGPGVPFTSFSLFLGAALAVTAFPVLARILTDRGLERTELGVMALACAAADDVTAWCLLALVVGVAQAEFSAAVRTVVLACGFIALMFVAVRPLASRSLAGGKDPPPAGLVAAVLVAVLLSALATEAIGVHAIFGAFLAGVVIPHDSPAARALTHKLQDVVTVLLLPAFFAYTGMRTQVGLVAGAWAWLACGVITLAATAGKVGATLVAARLTGLDWRTSAALGALMNTRGLMGLVVLNIGLDLGVISPTLFAMMVLMALATTLATAPALRLLGADRPPADHDKLLIDARPQAGL
jgi:Kef-type K+ transport system membrane component KefB